MNILLIRKMVRITIGPEQPSIFKSACQYMCHRLGLQDSGFHSYNEECGITATLKPGLWTIDDITISFKFGETRVFESGAYTQDVSGYIEGPTIGVINAFLKKSTYYIENKLIQNSENIKVLEFDFNWELDTTIKNKSFDSIKLPEKVLSEFREDLIDFFKPETVARYLDLGITHNRVYMLHEPPGTLLYPYPYPYPYPSPYFPYPYPYPYPYPPLTEVMRRVMR